MSGGLAPSKSTVYVSNLPFSLTNNDLHKIFEKYGRVAKVTIMKDRQTRQSKGVAFILYINREDAHSCVKALNNTILFNRTIKCNIAKDNGRTPEFIKRKEYKDKSACYECGEAGHLSFKCPKNLLGEREPPPKKQKKRKNEENEQSNDEIGSSLDASLSEQQRLDEDLFQGAASIGFIPESFVEEPKRKTYKKDGYFSDEEELSE